MMHRSVAHVLENFDHLPPIDDLPDEIEDHDLPIKPIGYLSAEEAARKVEDACAHTRNDCERRAEAVLAIALENQTRKFEEQLAAARREWTEVQSERVMSQLASVPGVLEAKITASLARVLRPIVLAEVRKQAVSDMRASIEKMMANSAQPAIEVSGPQDLLDALANAMSDIAVAVSYRADASCDLRVIAGDTVLETQMQEWASRLKASSGSDL
jgi:hypothetical protein